MTRKNYLASKSRSSHGYVQNPATQDYAPEQAEAPSPFSYVCSSDTTSTVSRFSSPNNISIDLVSASLDGFFGSMYISALEDFTIPISQLQNHGYWIVDLTAEELNNKRRCTGCGKFCRETNKRQERAPSIAAKKGQNSQEVVNGSTNKQVLKPSANNELTEKLGDLAIDSNKTDTKSKKFEERKSILNCRFHTGVIGNYSRNSRLWSCCMQPPASEPCSGTKYHIPFDVSLSTLSEQWQMHATPVHNSLQPSSRRIAVALDCEMGTSMAGDSELIRVTLIDYFTSEILIDSLVLPSIPMQHLNTRYSGVTWGMLNASLARGDCIRGRDAARKAVWRFVGPSTVVVAHSGYNDLLSLRWRHNRLLDTCLVENIKNQANRKLELELEKEKQEKDQEKEENNDLSNADNTILTKKSGSREEIGEEKVADPSTSKPDESKAKAQQKPKRVKGTGPCSLKTLTRTRLGREIQTGSKGHDSLEDALAARDLAHWLVRGVLEDTGDGKAVWES